MSSIRLVLTPQQEALAQALDDFRWEAGPTNAAGILGMPKETFRSLCYRRRRPAPWMATALGRRCTELLQDPRIPQGGRTTIERILAAAQILQSWSSLRVKSV